MEGEGPNRPFRFDSYRLSRLLIRVMGLAVRVSQVSFMLTSLVVVALGLQGASHEHR
jgi:hypothetical protein